MTIKCRAIKQQQKPLKQQYLTTHTCAYLWTLSTMLTYLRTHTHARAHARAHTHTHIHTLAGTRVIDMKQALMKLVPTQNVSTVQLHRRFA